MCGGPEPAKTSLGLAPPGPAADRGGHGYIGLGDGIEHDGDPLPARNGFDGGDCFWQSLLSCSCKVRET